jgi:1-deoxy-D-xylulose-5-phosphate reductoisomerase
MKKRVVLLGATGSIGTTTLEVLAEHPDIFELVGISAHTNGEKLAQVADKFRVPYAGLTGENLGNVSFPEFTRLYKGSDGWRALTDLPDIHVFVVAITGMAAIEPLCRVIRRGTRVALANKEALVSAGRFIMPMVSRYGATLLPIDSEHNAVFQCLQGGGASAVKKIILTASGGPFRGLPPERFETITPEQALRHPNFSMGKKITVDSATLANKGLELMEARWLFALKPEQLDVVVHPEQKVHAFVEFIDGSLLAQVAPPSMYFPIHYDLFYPDRRPISRPTVTFDSMSTWHFETDTLKKFPCFGWARECLRADGAWPTVFNAANEWAVEMFLKGQIGFCTIPQYIEKALGHFHNFMPDHLDTLLDLDREVRRYLDRL